MRAVLSVHQHPNIVTAPTVGAGFALEKLIRSVILQQRASLATERLIGRKAAAYNRPLTNADTQALKTTGKIGAAQNGIIQTHAK